MFADLIAVFLSSATAACDMSILMTRLIKNVVKAFIYFPCARGYDLTRNYQTQIDIQVNCFELKGFDRYTVLNLSDKINIGLIDI